jgi:hypothetical protein
MIAIFERISFSFTVVTIPRDPASRSLSNAFRRANRRAASGTLPAALPLASPRGPVLCVRHELILDIAMALAPFELADRRVVPEAMEMT